MRYLYAKQPFTIGIDNNINCFNSTKEDLEKKYAVIEKNLDRYTKDFLKKINLVDNFQSRKLFLGIFHLL